MAGDHGAPGCWNTLRTGRARQDIKENAAIIAQVDVEVDRGLREIGLEPDGSTDVFASQRRGLVTMSTAACQSHASSQNGSRSKASTRAISSSVKYFSRAARNLPARSSAKKKAES